MVDASSEPRRGLGPHLLPEPCRACGKTFSATGPWWWVKKRKACSDACRQQLRFKDTWRCRTCRKDLPRDQYQADGKSPNSNYTCHACIAARRPKIFGIGPHQIPHPCAVCGKKFVAYGRWSTVKKHISCSDACLRQLQIKPELKCKRCLKHLPREQFETASKTGRPREACRACWAARPSARPKPPHLCVKCGILQPHERFERYAKKEGRLGERKPYCVECDTSTQVRGKGPHLSPNPCCVCGQTFYAKGYYSHVKTLKTCSRECALKPRQTDGRSCTRCKKSLVRQAFDTLPGTTQLERVCRKCTAERDRDKTLCLRTRPTTYQMWVTARKRAEREGRAFELTTTQARTLYRKDCSLCGRAPSSIQLAPEGPLTKDNCRLYCQRCVRLLHVFDHQELFLLAHEIAARNPLTPPEVPRAK